MAPVVVTPLLVAVVGLVVIFGFTAVYGITTGAWKPGDVAKTIGDVGLLPGDNFAHAFSPLVLFGLIATLGGIAIAAIAVSGNQAIPGNQYTGSLGGTAKFPGGSDITGKIGTR